jgi:hypothetical protein
MAIENENSEILEGKSILREQYQPLDSILLSSSKEQQVGLPLHFASGG